MNIGIQFILSLSRGRPGIIYCEGRQSSRRAYVPATQRLGQEGVVPAEREGGWRKFTPKQLFVLMVCNKIRRHYGTPVERLGFVSACMMKPEPVNHLAAMVKLMALGLHVFLLTDLEETFVMDSDLEFTDYMGLGYFRAEETRPYIFLPLNNIVNRLLGAMKKPVPLEPRDDLYRARAQADAALSVRTAPELDVLQAIRSGKFDRVEVKVRGGQIRFLNAEGRSRLASWRLTTDRSTSNARQSSRLSASRPETARLSRRGARCRRDTRSRTTSPPAFSRARFRFKRTHRREVVTVSSRATPAKPKPELVVTGRP